MKYTVVHSTDPYLLARLATDLQANGYRDRDGVHDGCEYIATYGESVYDCKPCFHFHPCPITETADNILTLSEDNYIKVLTQILEP